MRFNFLPQAARQLWAKSGDPDGHSLLCHMLDVAAVADILLARFPPAEDWLEREFGIRGAAGRRLLAFLIGLHDLGKATPGFQAKWEAGRLLDEAAALVFAPEVSLRQDRHDLASASLLPALLQKLGWEAGFIAGAVQAVSAHHGFNFTDADAGKPLREDGSWRAARQALFDAYRQTLQPEAQPERQELSLAAVEWLAGLTSVCDWIGSNADWFPLGERGETLAQHFAAARERAVAALDSPALRWPAPVPLLPPSEHDADALLTRMLQSAEPLEARPLQRVADGLLAQGAGPALMVVEAPMGEGKTELAFLATLRLQARQRHRGAYLALPTQATGNALFERALVFLRAFADGRAQDIQLSHGGAAMNDTLAQLRGIHGDDAHDEVRSSAWFAQRRRGLLSPYGVGTVDQALFGVMNVKHHFVRLWGLADKVVVLDEVHAYDAYTTGLIEALLRWLKALGCSVVLMSATLPQRKRDALFTAWGVREAVPALTYPRVLLADAAGLRGETFVARELAPIAVSGLPEDLDSLARAALENLAYGGCGALIVNTVDRAQQLYRLLAKALGAEALLLFHARFPADERQALEQAVLARFGKIGSRPERALLIATQVAEQSLDIDFDFLISDLAPVDLLLQRAGRLHRHRRDARPAAHQTPRLLIAGLQAERLPELKTTGWGAVYGDYLCLTTWAVLQREPVWRLPQDIDRLVQAVYAPDPDLSHLPLEWQDRIELVDRARHGAKAQFQAQLARQIAIDPGELPEYAYCDKPHGADEGDLLALRNQTRLAGDSVTAIPLHVDDAGRWRIAPDGEAFDPQGALSDALAKMLYARQIKLSRKPVVKALVAQPACSTFAGHALLTHCQPLLLVDGVCEIGGQTLRLDARLGLVYSFNEEKA